MMPRGDIAPDDPCVVKAVSIPNHHRGFHDTRWRNPLVCFFVLYKCEARDVLTCDDGRVIERTAVGGCCCREENLWALGAIVGAIFYTPFWIAYECGCCDDEEAEKKQAAAQLAAAAPAPAPVAVICISVNGYARARHGEERFKITKVTMNPLNLVRTTPPAAVEASSK
jgi:hypothetical protein